MESRGRSQFAVVHALDIGKGLRGNFPGPHNPRAWLWTLQKSLNWFAKGYHKESPWATRQLHVRGQPSVCECVFYGAGMNEWMPSFYGDVYALEWMDMEKGCTCVSFLWRIDVSKYVWVYLWRMELSEEWTVFCMMFAAYLSCVLLRCLFFLLLLQISNLWLIRWCTRGRLTLHQAASSAFFHEDHRRFRSDLHPRSHQHPPQSIRSIIAK